MIGSRPFIERLETAATSRQPFMPPSFGASMPPLTPGAMPAPTSPIDQMSEAPPQPITASAAIAAINGLLVAQLSANDEPAKEIYRQWDELQGKLTAFLSSRKETRTAFLRSEDERLTREGRALIGRINELTLEQNQHRSVLNGMEESASRMRARLSEINSANPTSQIGDDEIFVLPEEISEWQSKHAEAQSAVDTQTLAMQPTLAKINEITEEIRVESEKLKRVKHERQQVRDELGGFDRRGDYGSGLRGRVAHSRLG